MSYTSCFYSHYCDNATTSEEAMLKDMRCPAGKYCLPGLADVALAADCSKAKYCPEGLIVRLT